jgi:flagellar hook-associated protein 1 FlgK
VSFTRTFALGPGATGAAVMADGVPITGPAATMPIKSGRIYGNAVVRDQTTVIYQRQLDATARGLVEAFAEAGVPGLFQAPLPPGAVAPPPGSIVAPPGTAGTLRVNAAADPALGGNLNRLRDGFSTSYNPTGAAGFSGRLQELLGNLEAPQDFDPAAGINQTASLTRYTAASASWVEASRKQATEISTYQNTFLERTREALSNETGVNLDEELSLMLELERSYGASARIITVVDTMIKTLLDAARP